MLVKTPGQIAESITEAAQRKSTLSLGRLTTLSILAGAYIALGGALSVMAGYGFPEASAGNPALQRLLSGATFPIGLMLVVILGAELFTGNNAVFIPAILSRRCGLGDAVKNWTLVWLGNFIGALAVAAILCVATGIFAGTPYREALIAIAGTKTSMPWIVVLLRGIGANWCVCLALWLAFSGSSLTDKIVACWWPVMAFVVLGFEHSIANMFFIPTGIMLGADVSISGMLWNNLLPATIGNIIGGAVFVGCIYGRLHPVSEKN